MICIVHCLFLIYLSLGGTNIVDQRADKFTTATKSNKWSRKTLCFMLDVTRINAQTIFSLNKSLNVRKTDSFIFGWDLVLSLVTPQIQIRSETKGLQGDIKKKMALFIGLPEPQITAQNTLFVHPRTSQERKRCYTCLGEVQGSGHKTKKNKLAKQQTQCQMCENKICYDHGVLVCKKCSSTLCRSEEQQVYEN